VVRIPCCRGTLWQYGTDFPLLALYDFNLARSVAGRAKRLGAAGAVNVALFVVTKLCSLRIC